MLNRRALYRWGTLALGNFLGLTVAIPAMRYLLDPLGKNSESGEFRPMARLSQLKPGEPQAFSVIAARQDAWIRYPPEPIGSVWLLRKTEYPDSEVLALSAECPHLSCPVNLAPDRSSFLCPCHQASFSIDGVSLNSVAPRAMDQLEVRLSEGQDPEISVRFERFLPQIREKKPLA